ncbi:negative regulation of phosphatase [Branchiostoma belcheri]|nr:negative regulation of phosphatase [Branchiostoma belcheri]
MAIVAICQSGGDYGPKRARYLCDVGLLLAGFVRFWKHKPELSTSSLVSSLVGGERILGSGLTRLDTRLIYQGMSKGKGTPIKTGQFVQFTSAITVPITRTVPGIHDPRYARSRSTEPGIYGTGKEGLKGKAGIVVDNVPSQPSPRMSKRKLTDPDGPGVSDLDESDSQDGLEQDHSSTSTQSSSSSEDEEDENCTEGEMYLTKDIHPLTPPDPTIVPAPILKKGKKAKGGKIAFDGVTVFYFKRTQGFTSVPSQGGSTLGMSAHHCHVQKFSLKGYEEEQDRIHQAIIRHHKHQQQMVKQMATDSSESQGEESESDPEDPDDYYFLQPVATKRRRLMLRAAGVKRIDSNEKRELRQIRMSREMCGCNCQVYCDPETCACSIADIKCQVDRLSFPCGCTKDGCGNLAGRIEFNPVRVRTHFIHTIMRLELEKKQNGLHPRGAGGLEKVKTVVNVVRDNTDNGAVVGLNGHAAHDDRLEPSSDGGLLVSPVVHGHLEVSYQVPQASFSSPGSSSSSGNLYSRVLNPHCNGTSMLPSGLHYNDSDEENTIQQKCAMSAVYQYKSPDTSDSDSSDSDSYVYEDRSNYKLSSPLEQCCVEEHAAQENLTTPKNSCIPDLSEVEAIEDRVGGKSYTNLTYAKPAGRLEPLGDVLDTDGQIGGVETVSLMPDENSNQENIVPIPLETNQNLIIPLTDNSTTTCELEKLGMVEYEEPEEKIGTLSEENQTFSDAIKASIVETVSV